MVRKKVHANRNEVTQNVRRNKTYFNSNSPLIETCSFKTIQNEENMETTIANPDVTRLFFPVAQFEGFPEIPSSILFNFDIIFSMSILTLFSISGLPAIIFSPL